MARPFTVTFPESVPDSEFCKEFVQGMADRMGMSFFKYGKVEDAYPAKVDALASMRARLARYDATGNREHLMDAANFLMIEFMCPRHPDAHMKAEDSAKSPGRQWVGEVDRSQRGNKEI